MSSEAEFYSNLADEARFREAIRLFDLANSADPNVEMVEGRTWPRELLYAHRVSKWLMHLSPEASEPLRLAARSQHICRWEIPRSKYPLSRAGYLQWRSVLKTFHAEKSGEILRAVGYGPDVVARVRNLNLKSDFPGEQESRTLEDALCLVFLEHQFAPFAARTSDEKIVSAVRKAWNKMTPAARSEALRLPFGARESGLIQRALGTGAESVL